MNVVSLILSALAVSAPLAASAQALPAHLAPPQPFPRILTEAPSIEPIAPGVTSAEYDLVTEAGPLVAYVVAVAPNRSDLRVDSALASNMLSSSGENVSSMARRTDAVAGINADYFDIGNTNRPTNIVVKSSRLLQTPHKRYSLVITRSGGPQIIESAFTGTLHLAGHDAQLDAVNDLPPPGGGITLVTPEYGPVPAMDNVTLVAMSPTDGAPPFTSYRVSSIADNTRAQAPGYYAAVGLNAYGGTGVPNPGDTLAATGDLSPVGLNEIEAAVGGGPLILRDGQWTDDPDGPNGGDYSARSPSSGAAIRPDGTLLLVEVDGRQPDRSIGVTRREFAALMRSLGATQGLAFDGGGSSAIAVRTLGMPGAALENHPSDGVERPVADGIFVYSTAPSGPAYAIVARPDAMRAIAGASIDLHVAAIDRGDHVAPLPAPPDVSIDPQSLGEYRDGRFTATAAGTGALTVRSGALRTRVPVTVFASPSRLEILPANPNVPIGGHYKLTARAFDSHGFPVALPDALPWRSNDGRISQSGVFDANAHDADVRLTLGASYATARVTVGSHETSIPIADAHFLTVPRGGAGSVSEQPDGIGLQYALGPAERAAYLATETSLPKGTIALAFDVRDDGSRTHLRLSLRNALNEQVLLPVTTLDRPGWRHVAVSLPQSVGQSARLSSIYVIGADASVQTSGSILIRNVRATVAGSP